MYNKGFTSFARGLWNLSIKPMVINEVQFTFNMPRERKPTVTTISWVLVHISSKQCQKWDWQVELTQPGFRASPILTFLLPSVGTRLPSWLVLETLLWGHQYLIIVCLRPAHRTGTGQEKPLVKISVMFLYIKICLPNLVCVIVRYCNFWSCTTKKAWHKTLLSKRHQV